MTALKQAMAAFKHACWWLMIFSFVVNIMMLTMPLYMLQIYDRVLTSQSMSTLTFLSIFAAICLVVLGLMEALRGILASRAASKLEVMLGSDVLGAMMSRRRAPDAVSSGISDLNQVRAFVGSRAVFALMDAPFAPIFIGILWLIHPVLFWMTLGGVIVLTSLAVFNQWLINTPSMEAARQHAGAGAMAQALTQNAETLRAMGMMNNGVARWGQFNAEKLIAQDRLEQRNNWITGLSRTLRLGLQIAILGVGALLVLQQEMTAGAIFASSIIAGRGLQPIDQCIGSWKQTVAANQAWKRVKAMLEREGDPMPRTEMPPPEGSIDVQGVVVMDRAGPSAPPVLNRVSFALKPGQSLGLVGASGSGKSTLARLLVGAQVPQSGSVRIDGHDLTNWDPEQIGPHIGYLGQQVELLPGTIAQNIARFDPNPDDAMIREAAKKAQVETLIQNLPDAYETRVGIGGTGLSGGQRQRIGLARAFYGNPQIMVLDEPNANLDEDGEIALHQAILAAKGDGHTVVLVTQHKQVLAAVDMVLRLNNGNVEFFDTREEYARKLQEVMEARKAEIARRSGKGPNGGLEGGIPGGPVQPKTGPRPRTGEAASVTSASQPSAVNANAPSGQRPKSRPDFLKPPQTIEGTATEKKQGKDAPSAPGWPFAPTPSLSRKGREKGNKSKAGE
ncbi:MAG: type I secretion system permease/ATPase [Pseudomonadota bacterium]